MSSENKLGWVAAIGAAVVGGALLLHYFQSKETNEE
jgi:hypothetical protein